MVHRAPQQVRIAAARPPCTGSAAPQLGNVLTLLLRQLPRLLQLLLRGSVCRLQCSQLGQLRMGGLQYGGRRVKVAGAQ